MAAEMAGRVRVAKLKMDENPATAARFNARSIPTLLVFKSGQKIDRLLGGNPNQRYRAAWNGSWPESARKPERRRNARSR